MPKQNRISFLVDYIKTCEKGVEWCRAVKRRDKDKCRECGETYKYLYAIYSPVSLTAIVERFLNFYNQFSPYEDKEILKRLTYSHKILWDPAFGITLCSSCRLKSRSKI